MANSAWSVLVGVELDTKSLDTKPLQEKLKNQKLVISGTDEAANGIKKVTDKAGNMGLTFQEANLIMQKSIKVIASMVEQAYELDGAITELKKVSDLSGSSLDNYVAKLTDMGNQVARTGKPKRLARKVRMVNVL